MMAGNAPRFRPYGPLLYSHPLALRKGQGVRKREMFLSRIDAEAREKRLQISILTGFSAIRRANGHAKTDKRLRSDVSERAQAAQRRPGRGREAERGRIRAAADRTAGRGGKAVGGARCGVILATRQRPTGTEGKTARHAGASRLIWGAGNTDMERKDLIWDLTQLKETTHATKEPKEAGMGQGRTSPPRKKIFKMETRHRRRPVVHNMSSQTIKGVLNT